MLDHFHGSDDEEEVLRLYEESTVIYIRVYGSLSANAGMCEQNLACVYEQRAIRAEDSNDLDRCMANLELALPHFREAARLYGANNHMEQADGALCSVLRTEGEKLRIASNRALASSAAAAAPPPSATRG